MKIDQPHLSLLATRISASSAMNPVLLLCLMVCPLAFAGAIGLFEFDRPIGAGVMTAVGCWPLAIAGWQLIRFTLDDPDRLQKEEHLRRMFELRQELTIKEGGKIVDLPISTRLTANPQIETDPDA